MRVPCSVSGSSARMTKRPVMGPIRAKTSNQDLLVGDPSGPIAAPALARQAPARHGFADAGDVARCHEESLEQQ